MRFDSSKDDQSLAFYARTNFAKFANYLQIVIEIVHENTSMKLPDLRGKLRGKKNFITRISMSLNHISLENLKYIHIL